MAAMDFLLGIPTMQRSRTPSPYAYSAYSQTTTTSSCRSSTNSSSSPTSSHHQHRRRNSSSSSRQPALKLTEDNLRQLNNFSSSPSSSRRDTPKSDNKKRSKDIETSSQATGHDVVPLYTDPYHRSSRGDKHHRTSAAISSSSSKCHGNKRRNSLGGRREMLLEDDILCECDGCRDYARDIMMRRWRSETQNEEPWTTEGMPWYSGRGGMYGRAMKEFLVDEEEVMVERRGGGKRRR